MRRLALLLAAPLVTLGIVAIQPTCTPWHYDSRSDADPAYWAAWDAHAGWHARPGGAREELVPPGC